MNTMMKVIFAAAATVMLGIAGRTKRKSPAKVDSDVAKAANTSR